MMETEYAKNLEEENAALRRAMHNMEDEISCLRKKLENTALTKEDLRGMFVTDFSYEMPTNQVSFGNTKYQVAGRPTGEMTIRFDEQVPALKLKSIIDGANNVK